MPATHRCGNVIRPHSDNDPINAGLNSPSDRPPIVPGNEVRRDHSGSRDLWRRAAKGNLAFGILGWVIADNQEERVRLTQIVKGHEIVTPTICNNKVHWAIGSFERTLTCRAAKPIDLQTDPLRFEPPGRVAGGHFAPS